MTHFKFFFYVDLHIVNIQNYRVHVQQRIHTSKIVGYVKHSNRESTFWGYIGLYINTKKK